MSWYKTYVNKISILDIYNIIRRFESRASQNLKEKQVKNSIENYHEKIIFSSYLAKNKLSYVKQKDFQVKNERLKRKFFDERKVLPFPISLKYLDHSISENIGTGNESCNNEINNTEQLYFPYSKIAQSDIAEKYYASKDQQDNFISDISSRNINVHPKINHNWMSEYEIYSNDLDEDLVNSNNYGTADAHYKKMGPPCSGCGALLNCISTGMPGYLPSELFKGKPEKELVGVICQRCHFLKNYNIALNVTVEPDYYNKLLSTLKDKRGLILLLVDLLDFPSCIWPGLVDLIGNNRPVFVVGNKVDLLPKDSNGYLKHIRSCLEDAVVKAGFGRKFIRHVSLVSAETGYGIENLITTLHSQWGTKGDVYIVGCTNVGKSTIFNTLLGSDFCKIQATDLIQRATASPWPGTTLKMLRFPILRPSGMRMFIRNERLKHEKKQIVAEHELRKIQMQEGERPQQVTLMGHIGTTFRANLAQEECFDPFSVRQAKNPTDSSLGINAQSKEFKDSRWCYDTPGVMHDNQFLDLLTAEEIMLTLPKKMIKFRNFCIQPGTTLLLAGLARVDYLEGKRSIRVTVFAADSLPIVICKTANAQDVYEKFLGTPVLGVPLGSEARLNKWPGLRESEHVTHVVGEEKGKAVADLLLSSAGWVSVTPFPNYAASLRHYTVCGRGALLRTPPLILFGSAVRGPRINRSPAYKVVDHWSRVHGQLLY